MEDLRVAALFRAVRLRLGWRQEDVGLRAGVDQTTISLIERGLFERLTLRKLRQVAAALEVRLPFAPTWRGGESAMLLDRAHASLVESAARVLRSGGWTVTVEYTFNHYGERGAVDLVGWRAATRTLLLVEVKSRLSDLQDLVATLDRKVRIVPQLLTGERGWRATALGRVVVLPETSGQRKAVARHAAVFSSAFPARTREVRRWLLDPDRPLAGVWFLPDTTGGRGKQELTAARRVRRRSGRASERESRRPGGRTGS